MKKDRINKIQEAIDLQRDDLYFKVLDMVQTDDNYVTWLRFTGLAMEILVQANENGLFPYVKEKFGAMASMSRDELDEMLLNELNKRVTDDSIDELLKILGENNENRSKLGILEGKLTKDSKMIYEIHDDKRFIKIYNKNDEQIRFLRIPGTLSAKTLDYTIDKAKVWLSLNGFKADNIIVDDQRADVDTKESIIN